MRYDEIVTQRDRFIQHSFSNVKTQQSPCCFRFCQSDLQAGIIKAVLQWQRRESFKGAYYLLNFHYLVENLVANIINKKGIIILNGRFLENLSLSVFLRPP